MRSILTERGRTIGTTLVLRSYPLKIVQIVPFKMLLFEATVAPSHNRLHTLLDGPSPQCTRIAS